MAKKAKPKAKAKPAVRKFVAVGPSNKSRAKTVQKQIKTELKRVSATPVAPKPAQPATPVDPYQKYGLQNETEVQNKYAGYYNDYQQKQQALADQQTAAKNASYDRAQNANYINYMLAQKALPEQMARLGLSGGASESSLMRQNTNYANTRFNTEAGRQNDINAINQTMNTNLENFRVENDQKRDAEIASNKSALYERQEAEKKLAEEKRQFDEGQKLEKAKLKETKRANRQSEKDNAYTKLRDTVNGYGLGTVKKKLKTLNKKKTLTKSQKQYKALLLSRKGQLTEQRAAEKRADKSAIKRMQAQAKINKK